MTTDALRTMTALSSTVDSMNVCSDLSAEPAEAFPSRHCLASLAPAQFLAQASGLQSCQKLGLDAIMITVCPLVLHICTSHIRVCNSRASIFLPTVKWMHLHHGRMIGCWHKQTRSGRACHNCIYLYSPIRIQGQREERVIRRSSIERPKYHRLAPAC